MGDRAMMSAYYSQPGQRPEDNVRAIADALAVYLAWSFRNSVARVKKTTSSSAVTSSSASPSVSTFPQPTATIAPQPAPVPPSALSQPPGPSAETDRRGEPPAASVPARSPEQSEADRRADMAAAIGLMPYEILWNSLTGPEGLPSA